MSKTTWGLTKDPNQSTAISEGSRDAVSLLGLWGPGQLTGGSTQGTLIGRGRGRPAGDGDRGERRREAWVRHSCWATEGPSSFLSSLSFLLARALALGLHHHQGPA